jgi:hypothetical protein
MAQVLVPNIILTKNYELLKNLFLNKEILNLDDVKLNSRDVFFISTKNNKYLNSFEYKLNVDNKVEILVRIFDFDNNFEYEYLSDGFLKNYFTDLLSDAKTINDLDSLAKATVGNKMYLSFGIGYDLKDWADPMSADLRDAFIEIDSSGRRYFTLSFVPNNDSPLFRANVFYDRSRINPEAEFNFLENVAPSINVSVSYFQKEIPNVDVVLKDLLKQYISKIAKTTEDNSLIFLPSVFEQFNKYNQDKYNKLSSEKKSLDNIEDTLFLECFRELFGIAASLSTADGIAENLSPTENVIDFNNKKSEIVDEYDAKNNKVINEQSLEAKPINPSTRKDPLLIPESDRLKYRLNEQTGDLEEDPFYAVVNNPKLPSSGIRTPDDILDELDKVPPRDPSQDSVTAPPKPSPPYHNHTQDPKPAKTKKWTFTINISDFLASDNSIRSAALVDWYRPLNRINDGIQSLLGSEGMNRQIYVNVETNLLMLDLLIKNNIIKDSRMPAILIGDLACIKNYYHRDGLTLDQQMSPGSNTPFGPLKKLADFALEQKLISKFYVNGLSNLLTRKRSNSAFREQVILDELAGYGINSKVNNKFLDFIGNNNFFKQTDTPVFMHNLKNSNVLAITIMQNTMPYLKTVNYKIGNTKENEILLKIPSNYENSLLYSFTRIEFSKLIDNIVKEYKNILNNQSSYTFDQLRDSVTIPSPIETNTDLEWSKFRERDRRANNFLKFLQYTTNDEDIAKKNILTLLGNNLRSLQLRDSPGSYYESLIGPEGTGNTNFFDSELANNQKLQNELSVIAEYINAILDAKAENSNSFIEINKKLINENNSSDSLKGRIFAHLYEKMSAKISVRTLPFFWLAGIRSNQKQAVVLSKKVPPISGPRNPAIEDITELFDFFSGYYNIVGLKHVINSSECYSEFILSKMLVTQDGIR